MGNYVGDRAIVLGGSIAGLLAARMLAEAYRSVTVVDRDAITGASGPRRAVPQGHHIHALLARGQQILERLFPGFTDEMVASGVPVGDFGTSVSWYFDGRMMQKAETGLLCVSAGRPLVEERIRERVRALSNVTIVEQTDILGLTWTPDQRRITGARVQRQSGDTPESLEADVVIDATGRGSRTARWLEELGYPRVREERVRMDLTYTTGDFKGPLAVDPLGDDIGILPVATPAHPRGAVFARMPDRYALSLTGILGDRPPTDPDGFLAYAKSLPIPEIYESVRHAEPMGDPVSFRFPASIRRHYERMASFPDGLLVIGDAACVFNPVYGQGMTVAAMEAVVLGEHLGRGTPPRPQAFHTDLSRVVDAPWDMSVGADLGFPGVEGRRTLKVWLGNAYIPRLQAAAANDGQLTSAFLHAAGLVHPPQALMRPGVISRVLRPAARRRATMPAAR